MEITDTLHIIDTHVHSKYSFDGAKDGSGELDVIAETAISRGIDEIFITDHCDIDGVLDGIYPPYLRDEIRAAVAAAKIKYEGKLKIGYGVELGQPHARPAEARSLLDECKFDFVLGSLHNLRGYPDFYFLKLDIMSERYLDWLVKRNISELCEIARFPGIYSLAHITYVGRYLDAAGVKYDFMRFENDWRGLFHIIIENGLALEVNTSGLRRGGTTMPGRDLIALYRDCGGKRFTIGSDAHTARDIGANYADALELINQR